MMKEAIVSYALWDGGVDLDEGALEDLADLSAVIGGHREARAEEVNEHLDYN